MKLDNKNIIITGGAGGIGSSTVRTLLNSGANVGVFDRDKKGLDLLKKSLTDSHKKKIYFYNVNINKFDEVKKAINNFFEKRKTIDGLINNAAVLIDKPLIGFNKGKLYKYSLQDWKETLSSNLDGYFYVTREVVEKMTKNFTKGVIINVSSISSAGNKGQTAYSATKSAINALTVTWAQELSFLGIRVAGIAPGITDTKMPKSSLNKNLLKTMINKTPARRMGTTKEIAHGIIFIFENNFFCGRTLELDGGLRM
jgi:3-oxoacyl-[acyl-carrier protein] reductase|tara:strand:- start:10 stop:774 length:765 start_codon:yes stop_codon:yes gene_type:complete